MVMEDNSYEFGAERVLANSARVFYTLFSLVGSPARKHSYFDERQGVFRFVW
jgi:hypothetical protein